MIAQYSYSFVNILPHSAHTLGRTAERLAARNLAERGFRILGTNWTHPRGEIDIIAEKSGVVHFVEVKGQAIARAGLEAHRRADHGKMRRVVLAARAWLARHGRNLDTAWQLDIVEVTVGQQTAHIRHFSNV